MLRCPAFRDRGNVSDLRVRGNVSDLRARGNLSDLRFRGNVSDPRSPGLATKVKNLVTEVRGTAYCDRGNESGPL